MPVAAGPAVPGQSRFDKFKMGAMMGTTVGVVAGFIFGTVNVIRFGAGPNGVMRTIGQFMLTMGATFGCFMSIGSTIRSDSSQIAAEAFAQARRQPRILPRQFPRSS